MSARLRWFNFLALLSPAALGAQTGAMPLPKSFIGTWHLVAFESRDSGGKVLMPMGTHPAGQLAYTADGQMSMHIMNPDRPHFAVGDRARGTDSEVRAAFIGYLAYYGRVTVDSLRGIVTHHIDGASFPNWVGGAQVRHFQLAARPNGVTRLTLTTTPMQVNGQPLVTTLAWER